MFTYTEHCFYKPNILMRPFELLILIPLLPFILWPIIAPSRPRWVLLLALTAVFPLIIHLILEQFRWQMVPAYALTAVIIAVAGYQLLKFNPTTGKRWLSILFSLLGLLWIAFAFFLPTALPVPTLPTPTGPYQIGTISTHLTDSSREEIHTTAVNDSRELMAQIWYPAVIDAQSTPAPYLDALDVTSKTIARQFGFPAFLFNHLNLVDSHAYTNAPVMVAEKPYPIILFSHGLTGIRGQNRVMVNELVSHGYIVAAVDHTYANALAVFPDGRVIVYDPTRLFTDGVANPEEGNALVKVWAADLAFLLDSLTTWQDTDGHLLAGAMDVTQVGVFGHSTGGGATLEFCMNDSRCQAGAPLDSWVLPVSETILDAPPQQPMLFINSPHWLGEKNQARGEQIIRQLPNSAQQLTIPNTEHYDFSDIPLFSPFTPQLGLSGSINSEESLAMQNSYLLGMFNSTLKEDERALLKIE